MAYSTLLYVTTRGILALVISSQLLRCFSDAAPPQVSDITADYVYRSIPCKLYQRTSVDCKNRNLVSIPPLPHRKLLENLDLSFNNLTFLPDNAFHSMHNLIILDLSQNDLKNIYGSPFRDLISLQYLYLRQNSIYSIGDATFVGLEHLRSLYLTTFPGSRYLNDIVGTPFVKLQSLRKLVLMVDSDVDNAHGIFTGIQKLTLLEIDVCCSAVDWSEFMCSLQSLHSLKIFGYPIGLNSGNECFQQMNLTNLNYAMSNFHGNTPPAFYLFHSLTSITLMGHYTRCTDFVTLLSQIDAPLEHLSVDITCETFFVFNTTTFALWAKWNSSLISLDIDINNNGRTNIEGSPFVWFTNLRNLTVYNQGNQRVVTLPVETFNGLENLEELTFTEYFDVILALYVFSHLKRLDLRKNQIKYIDQNQFCSHVSNLECLDLSDNAMDLSGESPCPSLPHLKTLRIADNTHNMAIIFPALCQMSPDLQEIDISGHQTNAILFNGGKYCTRLENLYLSRTYITTDYIDGTPWPGLNELHLNQLRYIDLEFVTSIKQVMVAFYSPALTRLDVSSNQIENIDTEDVTFLTNLTYLNLANNKLTSVDNLQYLTNIETLILSGNVISVIPESFLSRRGDGDALKELDLRNNAFLCECPVEAFRQWILADTDTLLVMKVMDERPRPVRDYQCFSPESMKGLSITEIGDLDCRSALWLYLTISISIGFIVVLMTILAVRYRLHIQYKLFLMFNRRRRLANYINNDYEDDDEEELNDENGIPRFDAYVAIHDEDEDWADDELLPNIEGGDERFRLCLRTRDVPAGHLQINAVSMCIQRSRKSLMILTPRFVEDSWCYFQLNMAHQRMLEEGRDVLILLILEDIPNARMTLILRQLFCKVRTLKWPNDAYGQGLFWQRLREELKRPVLVDRRYHIYPQGN